MWRRRILRAMARTNFVHRTGGEKILKFYIIPKDSHWIWCIPRGIAGGTHVLRGDETESEQALWTKNISKEKACWTCGIPKDKGKNYKTTWAERNRRTLRKKRLVTSHRCIASSPHHSWRCHIVILASCRAFMPELSSVHSPLHMFSTEPFAVHSSRVTLASLIL